MTLAERLLARITRPATVIDFTGARCLRRRFIRSGCDLCARACRPQALYPGEAEVRLDSGRCTGCLACIAACPTDALTGRDSRLAKAPARILARREETVIGCEKSLRRGTEIILPCLGALSREHLAAYALLTGGLTLLLHPCRECHSPWIPDILQARLDDLRQRWQGCRDQPRIRLHREAEPPPDPAGENQPRPEKPQPPSPPGRRDFFRAFREVSVHAAAETWSTMQESGGPKEEQWASSKHVPERLKLLQKAQEASAESGLELVAPLLCRLTINPDCTFCGACIGLCPSGAISGDDELQQLFFAPLRCSGCGLCLEFCPARAMAISPGWPTDIPGPGEKHLLRERQPPVVPASSAQLSGLPRPAKKP